MCEELPRKIIDCVRFIMFYWVQIGLGGPNGSTGFIRFQKSLVHFRTETATATTVVNFSRMKLL